MGISGILGSISSVAGSLSGGGLGKLFGIGSAAQNATTSIGGGIMSVGAEMYEDAPITGFAKGGRPPLGRPSWIGEEGPELWWPDHAGTVIPVDDLFVPGLDSVDSATAPGSAYGRRGAGMATGSTSGSAETTGGSFVRGGYGSSVPYQKNDTSREIERLDRVISSPGTLPPIKYETQTVNSYEFVTPQQLEESNNRTAQVARSQTLRELSDSLRLRKQLGIQ